MSIEHVTADGRVFRLAPGDVVVATRDLRPGDVLPWCGQVDVVVDVAPDQPIRRVRVMRTLDDAPQYGQRPALWFSHESAVHHVTHRVPS
jgi:hypothetical protein